MNLNAIRRRRRSRGAAITEAAVVVPLFSVMFIGMMYFGKIYQTKVMTMRYARQYAWQQALSSCLKVPAKDPNDKTDSTINQGNEGNVQDEQLDPDAQTGLQNGELNSFADQKG